MQTCKSNMIEISFKSSPVGYGLYPFDNRAAEALAPCVARPSAVLISTIWDKSAIIHKKELYQLPFVKLMMRSLPRAGLNKPLIRCTPNELKTTVSVSKRNFQLEQLYVPVVTDLIYSGNFCCWLTRTHLSFYCSFIHPRLLLISLDHFNRSQL